MGVAPLSAAPSQAAMACVRYFFESASAMSREEAVALSRESRQLRQRHLQTDLDFLAAVTDGSWGSGHDVAARQIRNQARACAAGLVSWPRRAALARGLEAAALAVLSEADARTPLPARLCARLTAPYDRVRAEVQPRRRTWWRRPHVFDRR
jgi:hypothetical protein